MLEHVANPIKALSEWKRITSGKIILIVPRKDFNFDHKRPITSFNHLLEDFDNDVNESDLTHLDEILSLHDLELDAPSGHLNSFIKDHWKIIKIDVYIIMYLTMYWSTDM